jgi:hypothetical protein
MGKYKINPFTGNLDIAGASGSSIGGSLTSGTPGSVLFVGGIASAPTFAQDNDKFHYTSGSNLNVFNTLTNRTTNGSFAGNATGWTLGSGWTYSANAVHHSSNGTAALSQSMSNIMKGKFYRLRYTISGWTVGTVTPNCGGQSLTGRSANGTYTEYFLNLNSNVALSFTPTNTARFTIDDVSVVEMVSGNVNTGKLNTQEINVAQAASNSSPGTTRHIQLNNSGSASYIDSYTGSGSTLTGAIGFKTSSLDLYSNVINFYRNPTSPQYMAYLSSAGMGIYNTLGVHDAINAGTLSTGAPSTLTTWRSFGAKHEYITSNRTLTGDYTYVDADADKGSSCSGTPSAGCGSWNNQTDCEKWDAHGGCYWDTGVDCSQYNGDQSSCEGNGCTWATASCEGAGDETTCTDQNNAYGGNCAWNLSYADCSDFNGSQYDCEDGTGYQCTWTEANISDCSTFNGDQGSCEGTSGCEWDYGDDYTCSGSYESSPSSCSGSYENGASCDGTYSTGNCEGSGGSCVGTATCAGIDDETNCGFETGCSWTTGLTLTMPSDITFQTNFMRSYFIRNIGASANLTLLPNTNQTVNGTTSLVIAAGKARHISLAYFNASCSSFSEGNCTPAGCEWYVPENPEEESYCSGTYTVIRDWSVYGGVF